MSNSTGNQGMGMRNRLAGEKSPYLLQHAANPVDWYPWSDEAFQRARELDRPVFISIGYATCHWCHVMERESFEDADVAALMNETFVSIKIDREERPDLDHYFMSVCQRLTGSGGWPLTVLATPEGTPFFAGTYFPRTSRFGRVGMVDLVPRLGALWAEKRDEVQQAAEQLAAALSRADTVSGSLDPGRTLSKATEQLAEHYDAERGGFGRAPKFPHPDFLRFLLRAWRRSGDSTLLDMVQATLTAMRHGGIYDHVGFGFHRYSTDERWLLPHFEKMLYDQALLAVTYTEAWQATGTRLFRQTSEEIFTYVLRDLRRPEGCFCCAEDADSEGEEGRFYLWSHGELKELLEREELVLLEKFFHVRQEGNFIDELGSASDRNILYGQLEGTASPEERHLFSEIRIKLLKARGRRVRPLLDDKVITDWNGLMIAALAKGYAAFGTRDYLDAAETAAAFAGKTLTSADGTLRHRWRGGAAELPAHVDDYAFLTWGLIELYGASLRPGYLAEACRLTGRMIDLFWDNDAGGLFFSAAGERRLPLRQKIVDDGSCPSGNSVAAVNLMRLARLTGDISYEERAAALLDAFAGEVTAHPTASTHLLGAVDMAHGGTEEVVLTGGTGLEELLTYLRREYLPNTTLHVLDEDTDALFSLAPHLKDFPSGGRRAMAHLCRGQHCERPVETAEELKQLYASAPGFEGVAWG